MRATRLKGQGGGEIRLVLPKGVLVILTTDEYVRALNRGKAVRRAERQARHLAQHQARRDAERLAWVTGARAVWPQK
jgi:hypothetical protein